MGRSKSTLDWFGVPLVVAQVESLLAGGVDEVVVVTGMSDREVRPLIEGAPHARRVHNPDFAQGKTTSVRAGVAALGDDVDTVVLLAVDQPRPSWVVRLVLDSHLASGALLTSPRFEGHGGHPLAFSAELFPELAAVTEERQGIREVLRRHEHEVNRVEFETAVVRLDLNTPEAYEAALSGYQSLVSS